MKKTVTYEQALYNSRLVDALPLATEDKKLPAETAASVVMAQVAWATICKTFDDNMTEALKKMKKDGFDERAQEITKMEDIDKRVKAHAEWDLKGEEPVKPTEDEIKEADKIRETSGAFYAELAELNDVYLAARSKEFAKEVKDTPDAFTRKELADIIDILNPLGTVRMVVHVNNDGTLAEDDIPCRSFITMIAANLVE